MLVDTSVWIDYFNGYPSKPADRLCKAIAGNEPISLPGIVVTEILLGLRTEAEARRISGLLTAFESAPPFDDQDYRDAACLYRTCPVIRLFARIVDL